MTKRYLQVARWEYTEKIRSKAFLVSLFLMPVIMVAVGVIPALLASRADTETKTIGVIDGTGAMFQPLSGALEERYRLSDGKPNYFLLPIVTDSTADLGAAKRTADSLVISGTIEGFIVLKPTLMNDSTVEYRSENVGNVRITERLGSVLRSLMIERKLRSQGMNPDLVNQLTRPVELKTIKLSKTGQEEESGFGQVFFTAYIFMMMMFFLVNTSGQLLVRSMLEEKSNRVVEILVSSCSAGDLMTGKLIGLSGLALTQVSFWALIGIGVSARFSIPLIAGPSALLMLVYFIFGYLLYAAIFIAAGSPVSTEQEAAQINSYLAMILIVPIVVAFMVVQDPNSTVVRVLSFIPLLTPSMMAMRIPIQLPSPAELGASILLLAASAAVMMWIAARIFRTAILSYGKRPGLGELVRLVTSSNV